MKQSSLMLFLAIAVSWLPAAAVEPEPVTKVISLNGIINGNVCIEGLAGTYQVDEDFPDSRHIRITGREVYVSRVIISQTADTLNISLNLPSWLKVPGPSDLQVSVTGPELTSLTLSKGSDIAVQGFYSTPRSLTLNVRGKSCLLFNNPVKTATINVGVSGGSTFTINAAQAEDMTMTLSENSQGYIGGASVFTRLTVNASGASKAFVTKTVADNIDFYATDMSEIGYDIKADKSMRVKNLRGGIIKQSNEIPQKKGLL